MGRQLMDEIIVCRTDTLECFWLITKSTDNSPNVRKITTYTCTGDSVAARFLPEQLYRPHISIDSAKRLALLTLWYSAKENPSSIGDPFEVYLLQGTPATPSPEFYTSAQLESLTTRFLRLVSTGLDELPSI